MTDFDAYYTWLGIPPAEQPPDYYRLLGLARFESDTTVISNASDQRTAFLRTKQNGPHAAESQQLLNEIRRATRCLLDSERRTAYDAQLRMTTSAAPPALPNTAHSDVPALVRPLPVRRVAPPDHSAEAIGPDPPNILHRLHTQHSRVKQFFRENKQYAIVGITLAVALGVGAIVGIVLATRPTNSKVAEDIGSSTIVNKPVAEKPDGDQSATKRTANTKPLTDATVTDQLVTDAVTGNAPVETAVAGSERDESQKPSAPSSARADEATPKQSGSPRSSSASSAGDAASVGVTPATNEAAKIQAKRRAKAFPKVDIQFPANKETWPPESRLPKAPNPRPRQDHFQNKGRHPRPTRENPIVLDGRKKTSYVDLFVGGGEHQIELGFTREEGNGGLALAFSFGTSTCVLVLDGYTDIGPFSGLDMVQGHPVFDKENPTAVYGAVLETGKRHQLKVVSLRNRVFVDLDGRRLVDFEGPSTDVAGSSLIYPPEPRRKALRASGALFKIDRFVGRAAWFIGGPESLPAGTVTQIPGAGRPEEKPKFAASFGGTLSFETTTAPVLDFRQPFTFELWFRQRDLVNDRFQLLNGCIRVEFRKESDTKQTLSLGSRGGGTHGTLASFDTNWHHLAVCNDRYYIELFLDGTFVARLPSTYFIREETEAIEIGFQPSRGSRIREFRGQVRDVRVSSIARYPRSQSFTPPDILGWDEHSTLRLDLRTKDPPSLQSSMSKFGNVSLNNRDVKFVPLD